MPGFTTTINLYACACDETEWQLLRKKPYTETLARGRERGRERLAWMDNTNSWTGLADVSSMAEDRVQWHKAVSP